MYKGVRNADCYQNIHVHRVEDFQQSENVMKLFIKYLLKENLPS